MQIDLIEKIKNTLKKEWDMVFYSDYQVSYYPDFLFNRTADYDIYARYIWLYIMKQNLSKKQFVQKISNYLFKLSKWYAENRTQNDSIAFYASKIRCTHVARLIYKLPQKSDFNFAKKAYLISIQIELAQKYRTHCCENLNCTDNAERRYFFRSRIVYIREMNAYVLTNLRKYIYNEQKDMYSLDKEIYYELLDYCPFCGNNLKEKRIQHRNAKSIIEEKIWQWRDGAIGLIGYDEQEFHQMTHYGVNCYDSYYFIIKKLVERYAKFNNKYGVDTEGNIHKNGKFITIEKLFALCNKYKLFPFAIDDEIKGLTPENFTDYFRNKFLKKEEFNKNEIETLIRILTDIMWDMFHNPQYFDELANGDL